jgi:hypothetical protein
MLKERKEKNILSESRKKFLEIIRKNKLDDVGVSILVKTFKDCGKNYLIYGVTGVGACKLMYLNRICPFGK